MSSQNFDPEWAKHLKHNPDRPLAPDMKGLSLTWADCRKMMLAGQQKGPQPLQHNENKRPRGSMQPSKTWIEVKLRILSSGEEMTIPCETGTFVQELAERLGFKLGINPYDLSFVHKAGACYRTMYFHEQVARSMTVKGTQSFKRLPQKYDHPRAIIGAGHCGLRMAIFLVRRQQLDFVVFDRMFRVGGTSWMYQANSTSKLQTEFGAYHLDYGEDSEINNDFTNPWPSRNALLDHFERVSRDEGIMPYIRLNTNVKSMQEHTRGKEWSGPAALRIEKYELIIEKMTTGRLKYGKLNCASADEDVNEENLCVSSICMFPGNLTLPRMETYKGEEIFDGDIGYAMFNEIDYHALEGEPVAIIGHGAFAVENIRTCCEFGVSQMYLICRRKNLSCPRICSWMANRSMNPLNNSRFMKAMDIMYSLANFDPWAYHSVQANEKRTTCQITQKARFGIGDIYFLSIYMGYCELIVDPGGVKRLTQHMIHLDSGRKVGCKAILKLLGLVGEMDNDRLLKIKEMTGFWVNEDPRRYIVSEPVSVMCSQMGGTSLSPGAYAWCMEGLYFIDYPQDFTAGPLASGMLPRHKVDNTDSSTPRPAYVVDARHGTTTAMAVGMFTPGLQELEATAGFIKACRYRLCHPIKKFLAQATEDWDYYAEKMREKGFGKDKPYPTYPYTFDVVKGQYFEHMQESGEPPLPTDEEDWKPP